MNKKQVNFNAPGESSKQTAPSSSMKRQTTKFASATSQKEEEDYEFDDFEQESPAKNKQIIT